MNVHKEKLTVDVGAFSLKSCRKYQEDAANCETLLIKRVGLLSCSVVSDGHKGSQVATMIADTFIPFFKYYLERYKDEMSIEFGLKFACSMCEEVTWKKKDLGLSGSTLLASCIDVKATILRIVCVGNSRGVLVGVDGVRFVTNDHQPEYKAEKMYIKNHGGFVYKNRLYGLLKFSRSIGDIYFKTYCNSRNKTVGPVNATPDYYERFLTLDDEYYIEATSGFWRVVKIKELSSLIADARYLNKEHFLKKYPPSKKVTQKYKKVICKSMVMKIAARLVYIAVIHRASRENTTVVIKMFNWR